MMFRQVFVMIFFLMSDDSEHENMRTIVHNVTLHMNQHKWVDSLWFTFFDFAEKLIRWRISANDECEFYEFSIHTIRELHTNHELW